MEQLTNIIFDYARTARIGLPEAVFSEGKPFDDLLELLKRFTTGDPPVLFTRLDKHIFEKVPEIVRKAYNYEAISRTAYAASFPKKPAPGVAIISAGASDAPVALEAYRTLEYLGIERELFEDCGVAGLWRLTERLPLINKYSSVIVVAGMEGALASVVGGLCGKPVFAVPTSVGYGVAANGQAALTGMLASCAPGISVFNIDNGYGAACAAARVANLL